MKHFFLFIFLPLVVISVNAQEASVPDNGDNQFWNDVQLTVPINKKFDLFFQGTARFDQNASRFYDRRGAIGFTYKPTAGFSVQPFYWNIEARNASGRFRTEHQFNLRAVYRFPTKSFGLSHRSQFERRVRRPQNSWRYRPSLTFEKDLPSKVIPRAKFFVTEEVFYDSLLKRFSRNRLSAGINKTFTENFSLDIYYLRQTDGVSRPGDLNVIGTAFRFRL